MLFMIRDSQGLQSPELQQAALLLLQWQQGRKTSAADCLARVHICQGDKIGIVTITNTVGFHFDLGLICSNCKRSRAFQGPPSCYGSGPMKEGCLGHATCQIHAA